MFPNFIIAGAPKCGTTTLFHHLKHHPEIFFSNPKEPRIFSMHWEKDTAFYQNFFENHCGQKMIGEASGSYFSNPHVPERIFQTDPKMKLIFIFRNPLEQVLSYYWLRVRHGIELRTWKNAMKGGVNDPLFQFSFYYKNLSKFLEFIPVENIHIVILEDFQKKLNNELQNIYTFLGVSPGFETSDEVWQNKGAACKSIKLSFLIKQLRASKYLNKMPDFLKPLAKSSRQFLEFANNTKMDKTIKEKDVLYLKSLFYEDVKKLEQHLGKSLPWGI